MKQIVLGIVSVMLLTLGFTGCTDDKKTTEVQKQKKKVHTIKLAMTWPSNFPVFGDAVEN
ncbi:MAG: hypothetical protein U9O56_00490 [Campylobacterota bacterium]|nr:hypothetical protein [Campylobacterota bacterium]